LRNAIPGASTTGTAVTDPHDPAWQVIQLLDRCVPAS
jgi:hypothetical protein